MPCEEIWFDSTLWTLSQHNPYYSFMFNQSRSKTFKRSTTGGKPDLLFSSSKVHLRESIELTSFQHLCINKSISESNCLLPTITLKVRKANKVVVASLLLDFGSQRSYFSSSVIRRLGIEFDSLP